MRIVAVRSSADRPAIEQFFMGFFYSDTEDHPGDLNAALTRYVQSAVKEDPGGRILLSQIEDLIARDLTDEQLDKLIRGWGANVRADVLGISYRAVLVHIRDFLRGHS
jgi:hypothetical protein